MALVHEKAKQCASQDKEAILAFWESLYKVEKGKDTRDYPEIAYEAFGVTSTSDRLAVTDSDVKNAVKKTRNWSADGTDQVYNFYFKYLTSCHEPLSMLMTDAFANPELIERSVTSLWTLLIPKTEAPDQAITGQFQ